jgi:hypothetical protein
MKKSYKLIGLAFCFLSFALTGNAIASSSKKMPESLEEQTEQPIDKDDWENDCHLFIVSRDLGFEKASMETGKPINTFHLFIAGTDGKIIKDAQVIITIIDPQGNQQSTCALPFKGGYTVAINHLFAGQYAVEAEIITNGRLFTDMFRFSKA